MATDASTKEEEATQERLHLLPCEIQFNGTADVARHFQPASTAASDTTAIVLESSFRGRRLYGRPVPVATGFKGHLISSNGDENAQQGSQRFEEIVYWSRDVPPDEHNALSRAMEWPQIASAVSLSHSRWHVPWCMTLCVGGTVESTHRPERLRGMKTDLALYLVLLLTLCISRSDGASSNRLRITSLTIKVAYSSDTDALTFTGTFPSTVLNEQELDLDTELTTTFGVADDNAAVQPQQTFLMFQSKTKEDVATYRVAQIKEKSKFVSKTTVRSLIMQLGLCDRIELSLIVGDERYTEGVVWNLGTVKLNMKHPKEAGLTPPMPPRRLHEPELKPEIHHLFREPDARPSAVVSIFFSVLCFCPLIGFLNYAQKLGVNLHGLPSGSSRIWVVLFHVGLAMILILYTFFFFRLNLIQMIVPMGCLSVFCFFTGHQALCAVAGTMKKHKKD